MELLYFGPASRARNAGHGIKKNMNLTQLILKRIQDYLSKGGLFNPELMEHDKVRQLILDCRREIERLSD